MPADEAKRKALQKSIQATVRKLRSEGKSKAEIKNATMKLKRGGHNHPNGSKHPMRAGGTSWGSNSGGGGGDGGSWGGNSGGGGSWGGGDSGSSWGGKGGKPDGKPDGKRGRNGSAKDASRKRQRPKTQAEIMGAKHDLVIVPIFWKQRTDEMNRILAASAAIKDRMAKCKLNVWIDARTKYTPGQKFAYWEHIGGAEGKKKTFRVEIGAKEAAGKTCTVSRCDVPGTPGTRWSGISWRGNGLALAKKLKAEGLAFTEVPEAFVEDPADETLGVVTPETSQWDYGGTDEFQAKPAYVAPEDVREGAAEEAEAVEEAAPAADALPASGDGLGSNWVEEEVVAPKKQRKKRDTAGKKNKAGKW